jgi:hypothetical protein
MNVAHPSSSFRHNNQIPPKNTAVNGNLVPPWNFEATAWTEADHLFRSLVVQVGYVWSLLNTYRTGKVPVNEVPGQIRISTQLPE